MFQKSTNTAARAYAIRAALAAATAAMSLAWQTAPSSARELHHRHHHHHHAHRHHAGRHVVQATDTQASSVQSWNAQASMGTGSGSRTFSGIASYYGSESGSRTASGQRMNPSAMTAAHRTLPFGTKVRVTHGDRSVIVTINDRGPFIRGRVIDLSTGAARAIGLGGVGKITAEVLS
jgi:rare lipoprotein A